MPKLIQDLEKLLKSHNNLNLISLGQAVRLLKIFSYSAEVNNKRYSILEKLVKIIDTKVEELEEVDVLNLQ
jgi:GMP synthase PP-ATPase subunit